MKRIFESRPEREAGRNHIKVLLRFYFSFINFLFVCCCCTIHPVCLLFIPFGRYGIADDGTAAHHTCLARRDRAALRSTHIDEGEIEFLEISR